MVKKYKYYEKLQLRKVTRTRGALFLFILSSGDLWYNYVIIWGHVLLFTSLMGTVPNASDKKTDFWKTRLESLMKKSYNVFLDILQLGF